MSSYFDFSIERPHKGEWVCVAKSHYDEDLDIINPYILKGAFWDADYTSDINSLENITDDTFRNFVQKIDSDDYSNWYVTEVSRIDEDIIKFLDRISNTRLLCNDVCLFFDADYIMKQTDFLKSYLHLKLNKDDFFSSWEKFVKSLKNVSNLDEFNKVLKNCSNVIQQGDFIGIIFNESAYSLKENIKYSPIFKDIQIHHADVLGYSKVKDNGYTDERKQYELKGHVSYRKDISSMINEIDKSLERMKKTEQAEELAKGFIHDILVDFEEDEETKKSDLYQRLKDYCGDNEYYDDYEYKDSLIAQKNELELMLQFMGLNGRLIWNID